LRSKIFKKKLTKIAIFSKNFLIFLDDAAPIGAAAKIFKIFSFLLHFSL